MSLTIFQEFQLLPQIPLCLIPLEEGEKGENPLLRLVLVITLRMRIPTIWVPNSSDTNRPVQSEKQDRSLKFRI